MIKERSYKLVVVKGINCLVLVLLSLAMQVPVRAAMGSELDVLSGFNGTQDRDGDGVINREDPLSDPLVGGFFVHRPGDYTMHGCEAGAYKVVQEDNSLSDCMTEMVCEAKGDANCFYIASHTIGGGREPSNANCGTNIEAPLSSFDGFDENGGTDPNLLERSDECAKLKLGPGDYLYLIGKIKSSPEIHLRNISGEKDNPIHIRAYPGYETTIESHMKLQDIDHMEIKGNHPALVFTNYLKGDQSCLEIQAQSENISVSNVIFKECDGADSDPDNPAAVYLLRSGNLSFKHVLMYNNYNDEGPLPSVNNAAQIIIFESSTPDHSTEVGSHEFNRVFARNDVPGSAVSGIKIKHSVVPQYIDNYRYSVKNSLLENCSGGGVHSCAGGAGPNTTFVNSYAVASADNNDTLRYINVGGLNSQQNIWIDESTLKSTGGNCIFIKYERKESDPEFYLNNDNVVRMKNSVCQYEGEHAIKISNGDDGTGGNPSGRISFDNLNLFIDGGCFYNSGGGEVTVSIFGEIYALRDLISMGMASDQVVVVDPELDNIGRATSQACRDFGAVLAPISDPDVPTSPYGEVSGASCASISGYAKDPSNFRQVAVDLYVDGNFQGREYASSADQFEFRFDSPSAVRDGRTHHVVLYALDDAVGGHAGNPVIARFDLACPNAAEPIEPVGSVTGRSCDEFNGYAFDPNSTSAIGIHVYVDNHFEKVFYAKDAVKGLARTDTDHGFVWALPSRFKDGKQHKIQIYALDDQVPRYTRNPIIHESYITCPDDSGARIPFGEVVYRSCESLRGWAEDQAPGRPVGVHIYVDGAFHSALSANQPWPVPDVDHTNDVGFFWTIPSELKDGQGHRIKVHLLDDRVGGYASNPLIFDQLLRCS